MITALDTRGSVYLSLLQCNSNGSVMQMFFVHLLKQLDATNRHWRNDTVILLDGAPYHQSVAVLEFFSLNEVPIMFTGPHSYDASPIELYFAAFKAADINPENLPTGKT